MDDKVRRLLKTFDTLSLAQKKEFLDDVKGFEIQGRLSESVQRELKVSMGPLPGPCPYCGK